MQAKPWVIEDKFTASFLLLHFLVDYFHFIFSFLFTVQGGSGGIRPGGINPVAKESLIQFHVPHLGGPFAPLSLPPARPSLEACPSQS